MSKYKPGGRPDNVSLAMARAEVRQGREHIRKAAELHAKLLDALDAVESKYGIATEALAVLMCQKGLTTLRITEADQNAVVDLFSGGVKMLVKEVDGESVLFVELIPKPEDTAVDDVKE